MGNAVRQARVVSRTSQDPTKVTEDLALFNPDGSARTGRDSTFAPYVAAGAIGTAAKTVPDPEPAANTLVPIKFTSGNTAASVTVAFNGGTARAVQLGGAAPTGAELTVAANGVALFWFDGTVLHQVGVVA